jgi:hypothetical protein
MISTTFGVDWSADWASALVENAIASDSARTLTVVVCAIVAHL